MKKFYLNLQQYVSKTVTLFWTVLFVFLFGNSVFAQTTTVTLTSPGTSTWTVPCGVTSLTIGAWGGGGAGGAATLNPSGGSGGGGGGYSTYVVTVTSGQVINYTIGSGGTGGTGNGGDGSSTTILALTANGGNGGFQDNGTAGLGGTATGGTTNTTGGNGTTGTATSGEAGGNGANGGAGGLAITTEAIGNIGTAPGGGGGGGLQLSSGTFNGGSGGDGQITITYNTPAIPSAPTSVTPTGTPSVCSGKSTNLNATSAGNTINWYTVSSGGSSIGSSASGVAFSVSPSGNTTYYAEAVSPAGCVSTTRTATALITVNPLPANAVIVTPSSPINICNDASVNLNATSAGNTIYWYTAATGGANLGNSASGANLMPLVFPLNNATTTYYADPRTALGCFSATRTATATVTASAPPTISPGGQPVSPAAVCAGSGTRTISVTATGVNTYQWRRNGVDLTNVAPFSGVTTATLTITNPATTDAGNYSVALNSSTCELVSDNPILTVNATPSAPTAVTPSSPVVACTSDGKTPLNATSAGNTIDWYTVPAGGTSVGSSGSGANYPASAPTATVYYAEARAANGCVSSTRTATASVTSNVLPVITTPPATPVAACAGIGTTTISIGATGVTTYQWRKNGSPLSNVAPYSGVNTPTLTITNPPIGDNGATFDVILNSATCLVTSSAVTLTVNTTPAAPTSVTPSSAPSPICGSATINLNATSAGNTIYWYTVATGGSNIGISNSGVDLVVTPPGGTTTYYAEAHTSAGCGSLTRTATAAITANPTPAVTVEFTENQNDKAYSIAACGHIAASENDIDVASGNPAGENATTFGATATGQWQVSYDNQVTWVNAPGPTSTAPQYLFDPAYTIFESTPGTYYFRLILTVNGCPGTSDVITLTVNGNPTLTSGSIAADQSSCASPFDPAAFTQTVAATVATPISGYNFSYQWQSSTDNVNFTNIGTPSATTTYNSPNISVTTYFRRYAIYGSAGGGCSAVSNTVTVLVGSLPPPTVGTITQPTCALATGSVVLSGLPTPGNYTLTRSGTSSATTILSGATTTISGLAAGTYNFTVTQAGCPSASGLSANVVINAQPVVPGTPVASVTAQPTCPTPTGTIVFTSPAPAGNVTYTITGPVTVTQSGATFANLNTGTYTLSTTNTTSGCTSSTISLSINPVPSNPPAPTASVTVQPTCSLPTGTIFVSAPTPTANLTYTVTGTAPVVAAVTQAGATFAGLSPGTYSVAINNTLTVCTSSAISLTVNAVPVPPAVPTLTNTAASCSAAGTSTISNYSASNTYTFSPTGPTVASGGAISGMTLGTAYTVTATSGGCTSVASASFSNATQLTTPAVPTLTAGTINCSDVTANWTASANVTGYRIDVATDNGFTSILAGYNDLLLGSTVVTKNVTGLASGLIFYIRVRAENSCGASANSNIITITTGTSSTTFTTTEVQPNCILATGTITISESVVDPSDQFSFDDGGTYQASNVKSGLIAGTYKVKVKNSSGCETSATTVVLNAAVVTTYSAGAWSNGTPDVLKKAIFADDYTIASNLNACSCQVNTTFTVTVNPGVSLVLENGLDVLGTGAINFENNSSLIQTNNVVNTGNITYKRTTTVIRNTDYTYWSSPVSPQTLLNVSPTTSSSKFYSWNPVTDDWVAAPTGTIMEKGVGYIIRGPAGYTTPAVYTASFIGVPNNGPISVPITGSGLEYLIGNPYPSALDADAFLAANPILDGTIYFWTHNTAIQLATNITNGTAGTGVYAYTSDDYASYNGVGGTATLAAKNPGVNNSIPSGKIAAGQSFFTLSNAAGTVTFENTMRVDPGGAILNNSQFFKGTKAKTSKALEKHRVWLNFSNADGAFRQLLIGYVTNATNGFDNRFDGESLNANAYVDFYSINDNKMLSIQGRTLPFDILDQVPLGYKTNIEGTFTINIDQIDGILANLPVFLEDKSTGVIVNLKKGGYSFSTAKGTFNERFVLRYIDKSIKISDFDIGNFWDIHKNLVVSVKNHTVKINSFDQNIDKVVIYDLIRRKLYEKEGINSNEFIIPEFSTASQFLVLQIRLKNGKWVTEKIVFKELK